MENTHRLLFFRFTVPAGVTPERITFDIRNCLILLDKERIATFRWVYLFGTDIFKADLKIDPERQHENAILTIFLNIDILYDKAKKGETILHKHSLFTILIDQIDKKVKKRLIKLIHTVEKPVKYASSDLKAPFFNIELYNYQKENVTWMLNLENSLSEGTILNNRYIDFTRSPSEPFFLDTKKQRFYFEKLPERKLHLNFRFRGGLLADEMGLGKTITSLALCMLNRSQIPVTEEPNPDYIQGKCSALIRSGQQCKLKAIKGETGDFCNKHMNAPLRVSPVKLKVTSDVFGDTRLKSRATLIVCPSHLCEQWKSEIDRISEPVRTTVITSSKNFLETTYTEVLGSDFVIFSFNVLKSTGYCSKTLFSLNKSDNKTHSIEFLRKRDTTITGPVLSFIHFHRVIIDEYHQLEEFYQIRASINLLKGNTVWLLTGTPFIHGMGSFTQIAAYLTEYKKTKSLYSCNETLENNIDYFYSFGNNCIRRNTKESIKLEYTLPDINESVKWLTFTSIEKALYSSHSRDSYYTRQLCCHPKIGCGPDSVLLEKCGSLDQIKVSMLEFHNKKILDLKEEHIKVKLSLDVLKTFYNEHHNESLGHEIRAMERYLSALSESENSSKTAIEYFSKITTGESECPICMDTITEETSAIANCGHTYCIDCLRQLTASNGKCANCRAFISFDSIYKIGKNERTEFDEIISQHGTKMANLVGYLQELLTGTENIIIFSQWDEMLIKTGFVLDYYNIKHVYCRGTVLQKNQAIHSFKTGKVKIILLSTKNSGSGLNLTNGTQIVFIDPIYPKTNVDNRQLAIQYKNSIESQAIARAHRIGQKNKVTVTRLLIKDTIEEEIFNLTN